MLGTRKSESPTSYYIAASFVLVHSKLPYQNFLKLFQGTLLSEHRRFLQVHIHVAGLFPYSYCRCLKSVTIHRLYPIRSIKLISTIINHSLSVFIGTLWISHKTSDSKLGWIQQATVKINFCAQKLLKSTIKISI